LTEKWHLARQAAIKLEQMELLVSRRTQKILELQRNEPRNPHILDSCGNSDLVLIPDPAGEKQPLILMIENSVDDSLHMGETFRSEYEIVEVKDARVGFEKAIEIIPDLILINIFPPQMGGMELCHKLKSAQLTSHIPVVLISAHDAIDCQLKALEAGADEYVIKPFNASDLKTRVKSLLESNRKSSSGFHQEITLQTRELALNQADAQFLRRVIAAAEQKASDFEFDIDVLAQSVGVSRRQLFRKLKAVTNITPNALIRSLRLRRASQLLLESEMTITEITFAVGFLDVKYFRTLFKGQFGVLPSEYAYKLKNHS
jgi:YesN/AraC family two-component response regulator